MTAEYTVSSGSSGFCKKYRENGLSLFYSVDAKHSIL